MTLQELIDELLQLLDRGIEPSSPVEVNDARDIIAVIFDDPIVSISVERYSNDQ